VIKQRGIALLEVIVIGFAIVLMVLPVISMVAKLTEATAVVHGAARDGAVWVARHGGEPPPIDGVVISIDRLHSEIEVTASRDVALIDFGGTTIVRTVRSRIAVKVSEYRSDP
jgi:hypothetical protein